MTPSSDAGTASSSAEESSPQVEVTFISGSQANADPRSSIRATPPTQLGRYRIEKQLGEGAMGSVYLARDQQLNRPVALKVPHNLKSIAANFEERFLREARCAATLNHANICPVYEVGEDQGIKYLAMVSDRFRHPLLLGQQPGFLPDLLRPPVDVDSGDIPLPQLEIGSPD